MLHTGPCAPVVTEMAHYFFGNQISSSSFVLNSDGTATVTERVQPSLPPGIRNLALTSEQITRVKELVEIIASTNATITSTRPAQLGSSSGSLEVNAENGEQYVVFQDRWTAGTQRITRTKTRAAAAAIELLAIVNTLVSRDASF